MPDKNKNKKSFLTDFIRYHGDEMTGEERNSFERELQKDAFTEEAAEGFVTISPDEVLKDTNHLQKRLNARTVIRQRSIYFRIAASIAVLMVISSIFIIVERNKPEKQPAETIILTEALEITENKPLIQPIAKDVASEKPVMISEKKADKSVNRQIRIESAKGTGPVGNTKIAAMQIIDSIPEFKIKSIEGYVADELIVASSTVSAREKATSLFRTTGKVLSAEDNMPVPGVSISIKGTNTGVVTDAGGNFNITLPDTDHRTLVANFIGMESKEFEAKPDSMLQVRLDPSVSALSEVVVVGYGVSKAKSDMQGIPGSYVPAQPVNGRIKFDKYIQENMQRPDTASIGQRVVVVVSFLVHSDGRVDSIMIVRSPGKPFSDEAIRLIKSGPSWKPAEENGKIIEDEVRVRIVFR